MTLSVMEKNTSQRKKIWRCRLCYVKPGGHVEDAFKQTNYWKKKAGKNQFISVYMNEVASLERNSSQKNKSKLYCPSIDATQPRLACSSALCEGAQPRLSTLYCSLRRNVFFAKTGDPADIGFNGVSYHTQ